MPGCCSSTEQDPITTRRAALADSVHGFSGEQGKCGWSYGYLPSGEEPFTPLALFVSATPVWQASDPPPPWSAIYRDSQHPNLIPLQWVARRWTSPVVGALSIRGHVAKRDTMGGDGVVVQVRVDGLTLWEATVAFDDVAGLDFQVEVDAEVGSTVDFVVAPNGGDGHDLTTLEASISW